MRHGNYRQSCFLSLFVIALCSFSCLPIKAAEPSHVYPNDSGQAENMLRAAAANLRDKQWQEAAEIYQKLVQEYGDRAVKLPDNARSDADFSQESRRWYNLREYVTALLAQWPVEGRDAYRQRIDWQAKVLWDRVNLQETSAEQAREALLQLSRVYYLSSFGDKAIEKLGDMAFQEGKFQEAADWFGRLSLMPDETPPAAGILRLPPLYPAISGDSALLTAKYVLSQYAAGQIDESRKESVLKAFAVKFPNASGTFAGRTGLISVGLIKAIADDDLNQNQDLSEDWPTFAGSPTRNRVVKEAIDIGARQWRVPLEPILPPRTIVGRGGRFGGPFGGGLIIRNQPNAGGPSQSSPILAYHPVIVGDQIAVCTENRVVAYNLNEAAKQDGTVSPLWWQDIDDAGNNRPGNQAFVSGSPRMTLTAHNNRLYGRMGDTGISLEFGNRMVPSNAFIVAFDIQDKGQILWRVAGTSIPLTQPDGEKAPPFGSLEGTPVADDDRVYSVITIPGPQTSTYVAALSAKSGSVEWVQYLFDAPNPFDLQAATMGLTAGHAHHLLTLANNQLYYQSDNGAVASLDAATGRLLWLTAYPQREQLTNATIRRDLNPAVYADGLVYVAPADSPHLFALEASNGAMRWKSAPLPDVVHLIGVAKGHVFASGDRVWTIEASTGKILRSWPDSGTGYEASGRGLLAGDYLYWPTSHEIHILDQKNGLRSDRGSIRIRERFQTGGGNLALGDGFLVVAGTDSLNVFTQNSRLIRRYEQLIAEDPDASAPRYRLATAAENINNLPLALNAYREALKRTKPTDRLDGQPMDELIRDRLYRLLVRIASTEKSPDVALGYLNEAVSIASNSLQKLAARMLVASVRQEQGQFEEAFREFVLVASDPAAHTGLWQVETHYEVNLALQARRRMLDVWPKLTSDQQLGIIANERRLIAERSNKPFDRTTPYFLAGITPGIAAAEAWAAYASDLDPSGRLKVLNTLKNTRGVNSDLVQKLEIQLAEQLGPNNGGATTEKKPVRPLTLWQRTPEKADGFSFVVTDPGLSAENRRFVPGTLALSMTESGTVQLVSRQNGSPGSEILKKAQIPIWAGLVQGRGLIFEGSKLTGFDPLTGRQAWQVELRENAGESPDTSPFVKQISDSPGTERNESPVAQTRSEWWMIQSSDNKMLIQNLNGHIWRIDLVDGQILWHRESDSKGVACAFLLGEHVIMRDGSTSLVLNSDSGAMERSMDRTIAGSEWCREPIQWDQNRVILATDRLHVSMIDLSEGLQVWTWAATEIQPHNGPPRFFRHGDALIAIADGETAVRLDPESGKVLWRIGLGQNDHSLERRDIAIDQSRLYILDPLEGNQVTGTLVRAFNLTDGSPAWQSSVIGSAVSWAISNQDQPANSGLWVYPDSEFNRRLVSGQVLAAEPSDLGENQGNISEGITPTVVQLDPKTGQIRQKLVNSSNDSGTWAVPDWSDGAIYWGNNRNSQLGKVQFQMMTRR